MFDQAFECYALIPDKNELSVQDSISFRLLRLILFQTQSFEKSTLDKTWLERYTYDDTNPVYNQLDYKGSQSCQELGLLMRTFELLLLDRQPQYLTAVQLDHQLNQRLNQQNQFLMRKLLDPIRLAS